MVEKLKSVGWWKWAVLVCMALLVSFIPLPAASSRPTDRTIQITASRFEYSPSIITVNPGDRVTLELTAADVVHGLSIDGYNLDWRPIFTEEQTWALVAYLWTFQFQMEKIP